MNKKHIELGIERLLTDKSEILKGKRIGLICNQASVNHDFQHSADLLFLNPEFNLTTLFGPQHGIRGDVQDNMIETSHSADKATGLPIYSLYSETREPTEEMLKDVDVLVFDLLDIGSRVYTFIYTMANAMKACQKFGKKFVVCDRPNPINGLDIEGNILEAGHESFVGMFPIPMRHGMTTGELALLFRNEFEFDCDLEIIAMKGWERADYADETDYPWVLPSPNMPTVDTACVFPGTVFFEGTMVSEGRGTTKPFEMIGAPYLDPNEYETALTNFELPGVVFRACNFLPTFQKHAGTTCCGVGIHVTDRKSFKPVITGIAMVKAAYELGKNDFKWKNPPYEYVFDRNPFDVVSGTFKIREAIENGASIESISKSWEFGEKEFEGLRQKYLLYV